MKLLVDTDVFCKLGLAGMLADCVALLGAKLSECGRLPALPYMLRRGALRRVYGPEACEGLIPLADKMPMVLPPKDLWLDKVSPIRAIDPGEAQILAAAADTGILLLTGDKRALRALKDVQGFGAALEGRIVVLEAILLGLCERLGPDEVRERLEFVIPTDTMARVCFSRDNQDPQAALLSYYNELTVELAPLRLWRPQTKGTA